jgi:amino acid adenylation domain-containing protein
MTIDEFITDLRSKNIRVSVQENNIAIRDPYESLTPEIIRSIKAKKEEILAFFQSVKNNKVFEFIKLAPKQDHYPLSRGQMRLWVLDQLIEADGLYNFPLTFSVDDLEISIIQKTLNTLVERHEILRTIIKVVDGQPRQFVEKTEEFELTIEYNKATTESAYNLLLERELFFSFQLDKFSIKAVFIEDEKGKKILALILHHIIVDKWSMEILQKEFFRIYQSISQGVGSGLIPLSIQYKDYSVWQNNLLESGALENARKYWNNKFSGEITRLNLPTDNLGEDNEKFKGGNVSFEISHEVSQKLQVLAKQHDTSLFITLLAVLKIVLYRYTGQEDIIIGSVVSGRDHTSLQEQIGFFVNTIALRTQIDGTHTFLKILKEVKTTTLDAFEHQSYPFDALINEVDERISKNTNPIFDVLFSYHESEEKNGIAAAGKEEIVFTRSTSSKFDLSYTFGKRADGCIQGVIGFNTELFTKEKITRMISHFKEMVQEIIIKPETPILELNYFPKEKVQILEEFNSPQKALSFTKGIKQIFEDNVKVNLNSIAILNSEYPITFGELNKKANQFAHYLIEKHEVKKGDSIAIITENTTYRIIALLGIIKSGGVYVPLDEDFPEERKNYILKDTGAKLLIEDNSVESSQKMATAETVVVINIENLINELENYAIENPKIDVGLHDIFAILYTSGSTGYPKGVLVKNIGIINRLQWFWNHYKFTPQDVICQKTPYVFDVSIGEIFMPLCFGAKLLLVDIENSLEITANIEKYAVTYIHFSPTQLSNYLNAEGNDLNAIGSLRQIVCSGEELNKEIVNKFYQHLSISLSNLYGPTEASIEVTYHDMNPSYLQKKAPRIPIGKPIENVQIYILDNYNQIVPIGVTGEIAIGGICLAEGYLNSPKKTKKQFIGCTIDASNKEVKVYKTGDLGKWLEDGAVQYLGRIDNQVSIYGTRIEPGEIETIVCQYPEIQNTVVIPKKDALGNWHLVAFYTLLKENLKPEQEKSLITHVPTKVYSQAPTIYDDEVESIYELLQISFEKHADTIALEFNEVQMSYDMLQKEVEKFAAYLQETYKIAVGDRVVLIAGRSEKTIISLLAILKIGAVYIPIDNEYPKARIDYIINDSQPVLIIAEEALQFNTSTYAIPLIINNSEHYTSDVVLMTQVSNIQKDDLCYICYTSGSTGKPKGVMITQNSVVDYVKTFAAYFELQKEEAVIQQSSISFDTSIEEIFPTLYSGAKLVILPDGGRNVEAMIDIVNRNKIAILSTTPLVVNELNSFWEKLTHFPRAIISGGDELRSTYIDHLIQKTNIFNTYGPTEFTVCASFHQIKNKDDCNTIGLPIANHTIYLLNEQLAPVVEGEIGEMFISGSGMAKGYLNNEVETVKYFVPNPFGKGLLYKTGDLARKNARQEMVFCGRKDNQVKIKGYRIELIEIDKVLQELTGIQNCITTSKSDSDNTKHLITYYVGIKDINDEKIRTYLSDKLPQYMVPNYLVRLEEIPQNSNGKIDKKALPIPESLLQNHMFVTELKEFLRKKVPAYMIPSHFIKLETLPMTVSGKVDRKALEKREIKRAKNQSYIAPKNDTEKIVSVIWQNCLNISKISINTNFFEIGGNSIKATQIMSKIHAKFTKKIPLKSIYNNPTIIELSNFIDNDDIKNSLILRLNTSQSQQPAIFCIPPILGSSTVFKDVALQFEHVANFYGLQYRGFDVEEPFDKDINRMAVSFVHEIQKIVQPEQPILIMGYSMGATIAYEVVKILEVQMPNIKLLLIDRGVHENREVQLDESKIHDTLEIELRSWKNEMSETDFERIKRLVVHNAKILGEHKLEGKIKADVVAIEAVNNSCETRMKQWEQLTLGTFKHQYVTSSHYQILETKLDEVTKQLKQLLSNEHNSIKKYK